MSRKNPTAPQPPPRELRSFRSLASFRLHKLSKISDRIHEQHYQRLFGVSLREYRIVALTGALVNPSFRRICEESNLDKAHVSRLINRLARRGLLMKTSDPSDQRSITVSLTETGVTLHRRLFEESSQLNETWLAVLSAQQRVAFMEALEVLQTSAQQMAGAQREALPGGPGAPHTRKKAAKAAVATKGGATPEPKPGRGLL